MLSSSSFLQFADSFFFKPSSSFPFAALRVGICFFIFLQLFWLLPAWSYLYGSEGYVEWFISNELFRIRSLPNIVDIADFLNRFGLTDNGVLYLFTVLYIASVIGLLSGWRPRLMAAITCLLHFMLNNTAIIFGYGVETFTHIGLFYLIFAPSANFLSIAKNDGEKPTIMANFILRVLQIHLCIVYFNAGFAKLQGEDWRAGEAVWYTLANANYSNLNMTWIANVPLLARLPTWWVLVTETLYFIFIWPKSTRKFWFWNVILLHAGISLFMGLYMFGLIMIIVNFAAFGNLEPVKRTIKFAYRKFNNPDFRYRLISNIKH
jgi:hypothetical protein